MHFTVMGNPNSKHQAEHQLALVKGIQALGGEAKILTNFGQPNTQLVACWGWRLGKQLRQQGKTVLVMERGYLNDRFKYSSLAWNGLNGYGKFPEINDGGERLSKFAELKPWKYDGDYILIMGQVPGDQSLKGQNLNNWYSEMATEAKACYGLPVYFRPHPLAFKKGAVWFPQNAQPLNCSLEEALSNAKLVITYNSNSAVDAIIAGVPAMTADPGSMAWSVTSHCPQEIKIPKRKEWASKLAWKQWTIDEIASGFALEHLMKVIPDAQNIN